MQATHMIRAVKRKRAGQGADRIQTGLMIAPTTVLFLLFCIYPILYLLYYSFMRYDGIHPASWVGLENYLNAMKDTSWWLTVKNTLQFGFAIPLVQIPLSLITAVLLNGGFRGRDFFRSLFFIPNITSSAVMGIIFLFLFATDKGIVNEYLKQMHLIHGNIDWFASGFSAKAVILLFRVWYGLGLYMVLFLAALQKIPKDVYESACIDGSSPGNTFFRITLPMMGQMFQIVTALSILDAMKLFDSIKAITNGAPGRQTEVMTMYIFSYFFEGGGGGSSVMQQGYASAVCMIATVVIAVISAGYLFLTRRFSAAEE